LELRRVLAVDPADDVGETLLIQGVGIPERHPGEGGLALGVLLPREERGGAVERRLLALPAAFEQEEGGELIHRVLLLSGDGQGVEADERMPRLVEKDEQRRPGHGDPRLLNALLAGDVRREQVGERVDQLVADGNASLVGVVRSVRGTTLAKRRGDVGRHRQRVVEGPHRLLEELGLLEDLLEPQIVGVLGLLIDQLEVAAVGNANDGRRQRGYRRDFRQDRWRRCRRRYVSVGLGSFPLAPGGGRGQDQRESEERGAAREGRWDQVWNLRSAR